MKAIESAPCVGVIIRDRLSQIGMSQAELAQKAGEYPQTLSAIVRGTRAMTTPLSLKLDKALGFDSGTLAIAQTRFQIKVETERMQKDLLQRR